MLIPYLNNQHIKKGTHQADRHERVHHTSPNFVRV